MERLARRPLSIKEQLQAVIPASDIGTTGHLQRYRRQSGTGGTGTSNALPFTIAPAMALDKTGLDLWRRHIGHDASVQNLGASRAADAKRQRERDLDGEVESAVAAGHPASGSGSATLSIGADVHGRAAVFGVAQCGVIIALPSVARH